MMHFSPVSDFPLFSENFQTVENFLNFTFSRKIYRFSSAKISDDFFGFFSHRPQISNFPPIFPVSVHFPLFREHYCFPPILPNPPCFRKTHLLFTYFVCISFPPT